MSKVEAEAAAAKAKAKAKESATRAAQEASNESSTLAMDDDEFAIDEVQEMSFGGSFGGGITISAGSTSSANPDPSSEAQQENSVSCSLRKRKNFFITIYSGKYTKKKKAPLRSLSHQI